MVQIDVAAAPLLLAVQKCGWGPGKDSAGAPEGGFRKTDEHMQAE